MYGKQAFLLWKVCVCVKSFHELIEARAYASTCRRDGNPFSSGACQYFVTSTNEPDKILSELDKILSSLSTYLFDTKSLLWTKNCQF